MKAVPFVGAEGRCRDPERGDTLIELLIAMVIMGTAVIAIVAGMGTAIVVSAENRAQTEAAVAVRSYAEAISGTYKPCAKADPVPRPTGYVSDYSAPSGIVPAGFTSRIVSVDYLNGTTFGLMGSCGTSDARLQKVRLEVTNTALKTSAQIDVMVRQPCRNKECGPTP